MLKLPLKSEQKTYLLHILIYGFII